MPKPYLEWVDENQQTQYLEIVDKIFIGRSCTGVDPQKRILVQDAQVSRDHAVVSRRAEHLKITDRSKNGTWVNGTRLAAGASSEIVDGDTIKVGEFAFRVCYPENVTDVQDAYMLTDGTRVTATEIMVTNVVADVRDFTTFSQDHASSDVYALMKEIFDKFSAIVYRFKGTIKDYAGDAVYAFWNHDVEAIKGQAILACQAAIKQTQTINDIREQLIGKNLAADNLQLAWGITTGKVTMSHYGSRAADLALVGDCTNLAFRFSGLANKELSEKIVICSHTADLVGGDLVLKDLGSVSIKGRAGQEHVFAIDQ